MESSGDDSCRHRSSNTWPWVMERNFMGRGPFAIGFRLHDFSCAAIDMAGAYDCNVVAFHPQMVAQCRIGWLRPAFLMNYKVINSKGMWGSENHRLGIFYQIRGEGKAWMSSKAA